MIYNSRNFIAVVFSLLLFSSNLFAQSSTPTVNGLYYGDGDVNRYPSTPYAISNGGSKLYVTLQNGTLYVALVVDRSINDNVFDEGPGKATDYMTSAGWGSHRTAKRLTDSEFAEFTLTVGEGGNEQSFVWQHGYAAAGNGSNNKTVANWISDETVAGGLGTPPPGWQSASSLMWNMNNYATRLANGTNTWTMPGSDTDDNQWKSPWNPSDPDDVTEVDGYPASGPLTYSSAYEWEWAMVYEWSVDMTQFGTSPVFVLTGKSHHSPTKNQPPGCPTDDDCFTNPPSDPLFDFGDLPENYATTIANNGARHVIDPVGAFLGSNLDSEPDGSPAIDASSDDNSGTDDEDGIMFLSPFIPGGTADIEVIVGEDGYLSAFIDFDSDGTLETVQLSGGTPLSDYSLSAGTHTLKIEIPSDATGAMYSRFRITNNPNEGGDSPNGEADSGEVEDYNSLAALGDYAWQDYNSDGIQNSNEPGLEGVTVELLDENGDPVLDADDNPVTTVTDSNGFYQFPGLLPDSYRVKFAKPDDYEFTDQNEGSDDSQDSDANPNSGITPAVTLSAGEIYDELDAGFTELLTLVLTQRECYRTLSSPFKNKSYNDIIGSLWTQGVPGSDWPGAGLSEANMFVWSINQADTDVSGWIAPGGANGLNEDIPEGTGFMMSIFSDDDADNNSEGFPKEIEITGLQHGSDEIVSPVLNQHNEGWTLVGNPFADDIDFGYMVSNGLTQDLTDVAYVYNINKGITTTSDANGNQIPGGWMTTDGSVGDIPGAKIAVFQGFFVQSDGSDPSIDFTNDVRTSGADFFGKEKRQAKEHIRLQLEGDGAYNSAWITFSEAGSINRIKGDAYELEPYSQDYTLLGTKKGDEVFDIGHFPDQTGSDIPLLIESTLSGTFSLRATNLEIGSEMKLIFTDREENISLPIDEEFHYQFELNGTANKKRDIDNLTCGGSGDLLKKTMTPKKAEPSKSDRDRFIISIVNESDMMEELPSAVSLHQNYPNPFNPTTLITYELPTGSNVLLEVYDLTGRRVATLVNEEISAGTHNVNFNASSLSSGVYLYRLIAGNQVFSRKLTVIK